jgi:hypothetical protein
MAQQKQFGNDDADEVSTETLQRGITDECRVGGGIRTGRG